MSETNEPIEGELILYQTDEGLVRIEVRYEDETFWLSQKRMAELFGVDVRTVNEHLQNIYASGELIQDPTIRKIRIVQREGSRETGNLRMISSEKLNGSNQKSLREISL